MTNTPPAKKNSRVLLVEDDVTCADLAKMVLAPDFEVDTFNNAEDALESLDAGTYAFAIVDINLFGMTGFELLNRVRSNKRHDDLPVVFCSAQHDAATRSLALMAGAASFLAKPYEVDDLRAIVVGLQARQK
jgi:DNA-binding response OmpR family regulator